MFGIKIDEKYDALLGVGAIANGLYFAIPAAIILTAMAYFDVPADLWTPVLLVYLVYVIGHSAAYGFQAVNAQIVCIAERWEKVSTYTATSGGRS